MNDTIPSIGLSLLFWLVGLGFMLWVLLFKDGWPKLERIYTTSQPAWGKVWHNETGFIGWVNYGNTLKLTANEFGLFLEIDSFWAKFRDDRPRLFIPWSEFHNPRICNYIFSRSVLIEVSSPCITTLCLPAAIFEETEGRKILA